MNLSKILVSGALLAMLAGGVSCKKNAGTDGETATALEEARIDGREAARIFVNRPWKDTIELQRQLLEARARQSRYVTAGRKQSAAVFDSAFVSTLKTVRPEMARELEKAMKSHPAE